MLKRLFVPALVGAALAGCGVGPSYQAFDNSTAVGAMSAQSVRGHAMGFNFAAGRPMNPFQPNVYRGGSLPSQVDLRGQDSPIRDQEDIGSCTAFAIDGGLRQFDELKEDRASAQQSPFGSFLNVTRQAQQAFTETSTLWFYYEERKADGTLTGDPSSDDAGSTLTTGMTLLAREGSAPEPDWTYPVLPPNWINWTQAQMNKDALHMKMDKQPPAKAYQDAPMFKLQSVTQLNTLDDIKATLASGWPVAFGFQVYNSFMSIGANGMMPMPGPNDYVVGGHAVMAIGYDDAKQVLIVRNSWGASWGDHGYFYMPYAYVTPSNVDDIWTGK